MVAVHTMNNRQQPERNCYPQILPGGVFLNVTNGPRTPKGNHSFQNQPSKLRFHTEGTAFKGRRQEVDKEQHSSKNNKIYLFPVVLNRSASGTPSPRRSSY